MSAGADRVAGALAGRYRIGRELGAGGMATAYLAFDVRHDRKVASLADRYRIERELGAGSMATVYLALDVRHDRKVAIKVLKPELAAVLGAEHFVVEIKIRAESSADPAALRLRDRRGDAEAPRGERPLPFSERREVDVVVVARRILTG